MLCFQFETIKSQIFSYGKFMVIICINKNPEEMKSTGYMYMSNIYILDIYEVCPEKAQPLLINKNSLSDIDVTWQPRRVDWNAHA